jgi:hypothetical protein
VPTLPQVPQGDVPGGLTGLLGSLLGVGR